MSVTNQAAWIPEKGARLKVGSSEVVDPAADEVLIKNQAWAINPVDGKMQDWGLHLDHYPAIFGCDIAGEIVALGDGVTSVKIGQRVIAYPLGTQTKRLVECAFQHYTIVKAQHICPIPDAMSYEEAVKLPLGILTAASGLYTSTHLNLPLPTHTPQPNGKVLLVWGGSSNVGSCAIQLAKATGLEVVATAGKQNLELVRSLGVKEVFDHSDSQVVDRLVGCLRGSTVVGAFDVKAGAWTAIGSVQSTSKTAEVLAQLGGGKMASTFNIEGLPASVEAKRVFAPSVYLSEPDVGKAIWNDYLPQALQTGQIRPVLKTRIAGSGLESIQDGIDIEKRGVSATKVVILA